MSLLLTAFSFQLKTKFPKKNLPAAPPKSLLKKKSRTLLEEVDNFYIFFCLINIFIVCVVADILALDYFRIREVILSLFIQMCAFVSYKPTAIEVNCFSDRIL